MRSENWEGTCCVSDHYRPLKPKSISYLWLNSTKAGPELINFFVDPLLNLRPRRGLGRVQQMLINWYLEEGFSFCQHSQKASTKKFRVVLLDGGPLASRRRRQIKRPARSELDAWHRSAAFRRITWHDRPAVQSPKSVYPADSKPPVPLSNDTPTFRGKPRRLNRSSWISPSKSVHLDVHVAYCTAPVSMVLRASCKD